MKKTNFKHANMGLTIMLLAITIFTSSCSDDDDMDTIIITVDDAAELVAFSLANQTYGAVNDLNRVADEILVLVNCNESDSNEGSFSEISTDGEISVNFDFFEQYSKTCETQEETVNYSFNADKSLTSIRYDQKQKVNGSWSIEGVQESSTQITYNGPYNTNGEWIYNLDDIRTDNVNFNTTLFNLTYSPDLKRITGGTSTFSLDGTSTVHEPFSYEGDVEFLGSDISIITFSTGEQYELNLETGEVNPI